MRKISLVAALLLALPFHSASAAYIDPGAGSMLLQLILGGVAGLFVAFRLMRHRIAGFFRRAPKNDDPNV